MFSAIQAPSSCLRFGPVLVVILALSVAGCESARFDDHQLSGAAQTDEPAGRRSPTPFAKANSDPPVPPPKVDLAMDRSAKVVTSGRSVSQVAAPRNRQIPLSVRIGNPSAPNSKLVPNGAKLTARSKSTRTTVLQAQKTTIASSGNIRAANRRPAFQWPVHGKILSRFGPQPAGEKNAGINIAVAIDTPIRCAEDGVVIYAGSGLKGFGNLVLVRHSNSYVTIYAHAKELKVNRGDQIKRGEIIGLSGQTGNVNAPQLYFEVRKDATPLDPLVVLEGSTEPDGPKRATSATRHRTS